MGDWDLGAIAERLQNAALDSTLWPDVLAHLSDQVGGRGALLFSTDSHFVDVPSSPGMAEMKEEYFKSGWNERDERYRAVPMLLRKGVVTDLDFTSPEEMKKSAFYQDFIERHGYRWFAGIGFRAGSDLWCLSIQRTIAQGPFQQEELERLAALVRPFSDAATLSRQLGFQRVLGMTDALELTRHPAVLLGDRGRVLAFNSQADELIGDLIDLIKRTLAFRDPQSQANFDRLFVASLREPWAKHPAPAVTVVRDKYGRRLPIRAITLRGWGRFAFARARVLLLLGNVPSSPPDACVLLASTYALTPAETRLAVELASGSSILQAADKFGITYETARSQLRTIFSKTDTHRQAQLVAMIKGLQPS